MGGTEYQTHVQLEADAKRRTSRTHDQFNRDTAAALASSSSQDQFDRDIARALAASATDSDKDLAAVLAASAAETGNQYPAVTRATQGYSSASTRIVVPMQTHSQPVQAAVL